MNNVVPPRIDPPKSFIGIGGREIIILGVAAMLTLPWFLLSISLPIKVGMAVFSVAIGIGLAFGRDPRTGKTAEEVLFQILRYYGRARFHQLGTAEKREESVSSVDLSRVSAAITEAVPQSAPDIGPSFSLKSANNKGIQLPPIPLNGGTFLSILSIAFLAFLLTWIWAGGLQEILQYVTPIF